MRFGRPGVQREAYVLHPLLGELTIRVSIDDKEVPGALTIRLHAVGREVESLPVP